MNQSIIKNKLDLNNSKIEKLMSKVLENLTNKRVIINKRYYCSLFSFCEFTNRIKDVIKIRLLFFESKFRSRFGF